MYMALLTAPLGFAQGKVAEVIGLRHSKVPNGSAVPPPYLPLDELGAIITDRSRTRTL